MKPLALIAALLCLCGGARAESSTTAAAGEGHSEAPQEQEVIAIAPADPRAFHVSLRTLQFLQDALVQGELEANDARLKLLSEISKSPPKGTLAAKDARAMISFLLSGGNPALAEAALKDSAFDEKLRPILEGAAAHALGDRPLARERLVETSPGLLPPALEGQISLIRATLRKPEESALALSDLRLAQSLMPGTLVEEAALRRAIAVAAEAHNHQVFEKSLSRYIRRFPKSIYRSQLVRALPALISTLDYSGKTERIAALVAVVKLLPEEDALRLFEAVAGDAVLAGNSELVRAVLASASGLLPEGASASASLRLSHAAILILGGEADYARGMEELASPAAENLPSTQIRLLEDIRRMALAIRSEPQTAHGPLQPSDGAGSSGQPSGDAAVTLAKARQSIDAARNLLSETE